MTHSSYVTAEEGYRYCIRLVMDASERNGAYQALDFDQQLITADLAAKLLYYTRIDSRNWHSLGAAGCLEIIIALPQATRIPAQELGCIPCEVRKMPRRQVTMPAFRPGE